VPIYALWTVALRSLYLAALGQTFAAAARFAGPRVHFVAVQGDEIRLALGDVTWGDRFGVTAASVVALTALVLATWILPWKRRGRALAVALPVLFALHLLALATDLVHVHWRSDPARAPIADGLRAMASGLGTFLFPLLVWLVLVRDRLRLPDGPRRKTPGARRGSWKW
jgi:hypothetical protein